MFSSSFISRCVDKLLMWIMLSIAVVFSSKKVTSASKIHPYQQDAYSLRSGADAVEEATNQRQRRLQVDVQEYEMVALSECSVYLEDQVDVTRLTLTNYIFKAAIMEIVGNSGAYNLETSDLERLVVASGGELIVDYEKYLPEYTKLPAESVEAFAKYACKYMADDDEVEEFCELQSPDVEDIPETAVVSLTSISNEDKKERAVSRICEDVSMNWEEIVNIVIDHFVSEGKVQKASLPDTAIFIPYTVSVRAVGSSVPVSDIKKVIRYDLIEIIEHELSSLNDSGRRVERQLVEDEVPELIKVEIQDVDEFPCEPPFSEKTTCFVIASLITLDARNEDPQRLRNWVLDALDFDTTFEGDYFWSQTLLEALELEAEEMEKKDVASQRAGSNSTPNKSAILGTMFGLVLPMLLIGVSAVFFYRRNQMSDDEDPWYATFSKERISHVFGPDKSTKLAPLNKSVSISETMTESNSPKRLNESPTSVEYQPEEEVVDHENIEAVCTDESTPPSSPGHCTIICEQNQVKKTVSSEPEAGESDVVRAAVTKGEKRDHVGPSEHGTDTPDTSDAGNKIGTSGMDIGRVSRLKSLLKESDIVHKSSMKQQNSHRPREDTDPVAPLENSTAVTNDSATKNDKNHRQDKGLVSKLKSLRKESDTARDAGTTGEPSRPSEATCQAVPLGNGAGASDGASKIADSNHPQDKGLLGMLKNLRRESDTVRNSQATGEQSHGRGEGGDQAVSPEHVIGLLDNASNEDENAEKNHRQDNGVVVKLKSIRSEHNIISDVQMKGEKKGHEPSEGTDQSAPSENGTGVSDIVRDAAKKVEKSHRQSKGVVGKLKSLRSLVVGQAMKDVAEKAQQQGKEWVAVLDEETADVYYFNTVTHNTTWEKPDSFLDVTETNGMKMSMMVYPTADERAELSGEGAKSDGCSYGGSWKVATDSATGAVYYYNTATRETRWSEPQQREPTHEWLVPVASSRRHNYDDQSSITESHLYDYDEEETYTDYGDSSEESSDQSSYYMSDLPDQIHVPEA